MSDVYILIKDTPAEKAGTKFKWDERLSVYKLEGDYKIPVIAGMSGFCIYTKDQVEENPEWFKKDETEEIKAAKELLKKNGYFVSLSYHTDKGYAKLADKLPNFFDKEKIEQRREDLNKTESVEERAYANSNTDSWANPKSVVKILVIDQYTEPDVTYVCQFPSRHSMEKFQSKEFYSYLEEAIKNYKK